MPSLERGDNKLDALLHMIQEEAHRFVKDNQFLVRQILIISLEGIVSPFYTDTGQLWALFRISCFLLLYNNSDITFKLNELYRNLIDMDLVRTLTL